MTRDELEPFLADLSERAGVPKLSPEEVAELLKLARATAHRTQRRLAPLTTYLAGLLVGGGPDAANPLARVDRLRELRATVEAITDAERPCE